jgi:hypothetical protein
MHICFDVMPHTAVYNQPRLTIALDMPIAQPYTAIPVLPFSTTKLRLPDAKRYLTAFMSSSAARRPLNWFYPVCRTTAVKQNYGLPSLSTSDNADIALTRQISRSAQDAGFYPQIKQLRTG